jgi:hypothetical protein
MPFLASIFGSGIRRSPVLFLTLALGVVLTSGAVRPTVAVGQPMTMPFPRLGMWWPGNDTQPAADRARYDWVGLQQQDADHIAELRALNPDIVILGSTNARQINYRMGPDNYGRPENVELRSISNDWILTQVGSALTAAVDASATTIPVADTTNFAAGEMVVLEGELLQIVSIATGADEPAGSLTVSIRGTPRAAVPHVQGTRVASAVSSNPENHNVVCDVTANCPRVDVGYGPETWSDWNVRRGRAVLRAVDWDGILIDCYDPDLSWVITQGLARSIDQNRDNVADDLSTFNVAWNAGMLAYGTALRAAVGSEAVLLPNNSLANFDLSGRNFEGFPTSTTPLSIWRKLVIGPWTTDFPAASYVEWCNRAAQPNLSTIETYQYDGTAFPVGWSPGGSPPTGFVPNYRKMRYGLTTALMGDGFFSYEISTAGHGRLGLYWFDEYDNAGAGRGYLGQPLGPARSVGSNVWRRDYQRGIALVNPDAIAHAVGLGAEFRKIKGTQARAVNDGSVVAAVTLQPRDGIVLLGPLGPLGRLTTPSSKSSVSHASSFTVRGTIRPAHASGWRVVKLKLSRWNGSGWSAYSATWTRVTYRDSGCSTYSVGIRLKRGRYHVRAYAPADLSHAAVTSGYHTVDVR